MSRKKVTFTKFIPRAYILDEGVSAVEAMIKRSVMSTHPNVEDLRVAWGIDELKDWRATAYVHGYITEDQGQTDNV